MQLADVVRVGLLWISSNAKVYAPTGYILVFNQLQ